MTSFLCDQAIDFDATHGYEAKDIERLIDQIEASGTELGKKVVIVLKNAHYLTTQAFAVLYTYLRASSSSNVVLVLVSADKSKIFPPLLDFVEHQEVA